MVTNYEQGRAVLADSAASKVIPPAHADSVGGGDVEGGPFANNMLRHDPPDHTRLRKAVQPAFSPGRVTRLRTRIQQTCGELIDGFVSKGNAELIADFAFPLPMIVICDLLGLPKSQRAELIEITEVFFAEDTEDDLEQRNRDASTDLLTFAGDLIVRKRREPQTDLVTDLVSAEDPLSDEEMTSTIILLLVAGFLTTVNLISNATFAMLQQPEQLSDLRADPTLVPAAVEEFLRYRAPFRPMMIFAKQELEIGGQIIAAGDSVTVLLDAVNHDPARFEAPGVLRLDRKPNSHLAFGHGIHRCVGAPLARAEADIAVRTLLTRLPGLSLGCKEDDIVWRADFVLNGIRELPVVWTP
jgi:cytochrome P450